MARKERELMRYYTVFYGIKKPYLFAQYGICVDIAVWTGLL